MNLVAKKSLKTRYMAFLVAFVLMFCMVSTSMAPAMAGLDINSLIDDDGTVSVANQTSDPWKDLLKEGKKIVQGLLGILTLICFFFFVLQISKIVTSASNEAARSKAIQGLMWAIVGIILFGGANVLLGFAWNVLSNSSGGGSGTPSP